MRFLVLKIFVGKRFMSLLYFIFHLDVIFESRNNSIHKIITTMQYSKGKTIALAALSRTCIYAKDFLAESNPWDSKAAGGIQKQSKVLELFAPKCPKGTNLRLFVLYFVKVHVKREVDKIVDAWHQQKHSFDIAFHVQVGEHGEKSLCLRNRLISLLFTNND